MKLSDEFLFMNYLLEKYATYRGMTAGEVLKEWDSHGITQKIYDCYWQYHTERIENAFENINSLMATGKHAW